MKKEDDLVLPVSYESADEEILSCETEGSIETKVKLELETVLEPVNYKQYAFFNNPGIENLTAVVNQIQQSVKAMTFNVPSLGLDSFAASAHQFQQSVSAMNIKLPDLGLDKLTASVQQFQKSMDAMNLQALIPVFPNVSFLTDTFDLMKRSNDIRATKYPAMSANLKEAASLSWFASVLMDFRSYEDLAFVADGITDDVERQQIIEEAYAECYRELFPYLSSTILKKFPLRSFAISPAAAAHVRGEYALSVPVFLSQAEGILRDVTASELFSERQSPVTKFAQQQRALIPVDDHWLNLSDDAVWAQLSGDLPIGWGPGLRRKNGYSGINRNTTLHGIDLNYASETNSLKAFSLLCHVAGIAEWLIDEEHSE